MTRPTSFLSGCDRKRRTPRKETGYEAKDLAYPAQTDTHTHLLGSKACTSVSLLVPKFHVTCALQVEAFVLPKVMGELPVYPVPFHQEWGHLSGIRLADPDFGCPGNVDVLLGADVFSSVILHGRRCGPPPHSLGHGRGYLSQTGQCFSIISWKVALWLQNLQLKGRRGQCWDMCSSRSRVLLTRSPQSGQSTSTYRQSAFKCCSRPPSSPSHSQPSALCGHLTFSDDTLLLWYLSFTALSGSSLHMGQDFP